MKKKITMVMEKAENYEGIPFNVDGEFFAEARFLDENNFHELEEEAFGEILETLYLSSAGLEFHNGVPNVHLNLFPDGRIPHLMAVLNVCRRERISVTMFYIKEDGQLLRQDLA